MKKSLIKVVVMNAAVCAALIACTGNKDGGGDNSGAQNVGEDTPQFTAIGKTKEDVEKAGFKIEDFSSASVADSKNVKFDERLVQGLNTSNLIKVDLGNGLTETIENETTITERSENLLKKESNATIIIDNKTGVFHEIETCTRVEKSNGEGENKYTTASINCIQDEHSFSAPGIEDTIRKYSTYQSCSVQVIEETLKNRTTETIYGTYKLRNGAIVKAVKYVTKLSGPIKCKQKSLMNNGEEGPETDGGTGTNVTVFINTPDMPSISSIEDGASSGTSSLYMYADTKTDNGNVLTRFTFETLK